MNHPIRKNKPFSVRLPAALRAYLEQQAYENRRSLNGEILNRLEASQRQEQATAQKERPHE